MGAEQGRSRVADRLVAKIAGVVRDDVLRLQEMSGRDLSAWLR